MAQVVLGSEPAFEVLAQRHLNALHAFLIRQGGNAADAEELTQETFLKLWRDARRFDSARGKLRPWLYRLARNLLIDRQRKQQPSSVEDIAAIAPAAALNGQALHGADALHRSGSAPPFGPQDRAQALSGLIRTLPARQREALSLVFLQGFSQREAATVMGVRRQALESLLARGRSTLTQQLAQTRRQSDEGPA